MSARATNSADDAQPNERASELQHPDSGLGVDASMHDADAAPTADAAPLPDATTTAPVAPDFKPGVVLNPSSSIALSFDGSHASHLPAGAGCSSEYEAIIAVDQQMTRAIGITFGDSTQLNTEYPLEACRDCSGGDPTPNFLMGDGLNIQVNINGIEVPGAVDDVSAGSIKFQSLTQDMKFEFSFSFSDGKLLQGSFDLPIKQDLHCPPPT